MMSKDDTRNEASLETFVYIVFETCAQMLLLSSMENQLAECNHVVISHLAKSAILLRHLVKWHPVELRESETDV